MFPFSYGFLLDVLFENLNIEKENINQETVLLISSKEMRPFDSESYRDKHGERHPLEKEKNEE